MYSPLALSAISINSDYFAVGKVVIWTLTDIVVVASAGEAAAAAGVGAAAVVRARAGGQPGAALLAAPARDVLQRDEAAVGEDLNSVALTRTVFGTLHSVLS